MNKTLVSVGVLLVAIGECRTCIDVDQFGSSNGLGQKRLSLHLRKILTRCLSR